MFESYSIALEHEPGGMDVIDTNVDDDQGGKYPKLFIHTSHSG